jgi:hypothetical protein
VSTQAFSIGNNETGKVRDRIAPQSYHVGSPDDHLAPSSTPSRGTTDLCRPRHGYTRAATTIRAVRALRRWPAAGLRRLALASSAPRVCRCGGDGSQWHRGPRVYPGERPAMMPLILPHIRINITTRATWHPSGVGDLTTISPCTSSSLPSTLYRSSIVVRALMLTAFPLLIFAT